MALLRPLLSMYRIEENQDGVAVVPAHQIVVHTLVVHPC